MSINWSRPLLGRSIRSAVVVAASCCALVGCASESTTGAGRGTNAPATSPVVATNAVAVPVDPTSVTVPATDEIGEPTVGEPPVTEPPSTEPLPTEPLPTEPLPTEPLATEPLATEPADTSAPPLGELDDLDEDGTADETCGVGDLGGGLTVRTLCNTGLRPTPEDGVIPTPGGLLDLASPSRWTDLADVDATVRVARHTDGRQVVIYVLGSDTLFDEGSSRIRSTATPPLQAIVASISTRFPNATIEVRGGADSVGSAPANLALSEARAVAVRDVLQAEGLTQPITSTGLGETTPVAAETSPDGSDSSVGRQVNRRVEIVVIV